MAEWFVGMRGYDRLVRARVAEEDANFIADCGAGDDAEANAKRIVACHNACEGMEDPAKTIPAFRDFWNNFAHLTAAKT